MFDGSSSSLSLSKLVGSSRERRQRSRSGNRTSHHPRTFNTGSLANDGPTIRPLAKDALLPQQGDPWDASFKLVQKFDDEMCKGWREEIDTLLVFAGLFSAVVTAFTVESAKGLQANDPVQQPTQTTNVTQSSTSSSSGVLRPSLFWFLSLTLSLSTVMIGILCKQWLREYQRYEGLSAKDAFTIRQMRYEGFKKWRVPNFLAALPLLLQAAVVMFFVGLLDFLWHVEPLIAAVVSCIVGLTMAILILTTILPSLHHFLCFSKLDTEPDEHSQCAFKSPQSWAFHVLVTLCLRLFARFRPMYHLQAYLQVPNWFPEANWVEHDLRWHTSGSFVERGMLWIHQKFGRSADALHNLMRCLESLDARQASSCVAYIIRETWSPLLPLRSSVLSALHRIQNPPPDESAGKLSSDIALVHASFLVTCPRACPALSTRCFESCLQILDAAGGSERVSTAFEILNTFIGSTPLSRELAAQLSMRLSSLIQNDSINDEDIPAFWTIIGALDRYYNINNEYDSHNGEPPLLKLIEQWLSAPKPSDDTGSDLTRLIQCVKGSIDTWWFLPQSLDSPSLLERHTPDTQIAPLICVLEHRLALYGGAEAVLPPWTAATWKAMKEVFLSRTNC